MIIPPHIQIGPMRYTVALVPQVQIDSPEQANLGDMTISSASIQLREGMNPVTEAAILLHEVVHGIYENAGQLGVGETLTDVMAYGFLDLIRQNPDLIMYLQQAVAKPDDVTRWMSAKMASSKVSI